MMPNRPGNSWIRGPRTLVQLALIAAVAGAGVLAAQSQRASTISGRVVSAVTGQPISQARISANFASDAGGSTTTDAQGRYELRVPWTVRTVVRVSAPGYAPIAFGEDEGLGPLVISTAPGRGATDVNFSLQRGGTIAGRAIDDLKEPIVKARVIAYVDRWSFGERRYIAVAGNSAEADDRGEFRLIGLGPGEYVVGLHDRSALTFAPSTASLKNARRITIGFGQEVTGVNIQSRAGASGSISGQITGGATRVNLVPESTEIAAAASSSADLQPGGRYRFDNVAPGRYWLVVRPGPAPVQPRTWARESVVVTAGADTTRALTLNEGVTIAGRVADAARRTRDISITPFDGGVQNPEAASARAVAASDGSFRLIGVAPGRYRWLRTQEASFQLSIFEGSSPLDLADLVLTLRAGDAPRDLRIEVTGGAIISGTISDRDGKPTTAGGVIIASTDSRYWTGVSRRLLVTRADQRGFYEAARLPADEYFVAHVAQLAPGQLWDVAFLKKLLAGAERVSVTAGSERAVNLRLK